MADDTIEIEYQLTVDDLTAFNTYTCKKQESNCAICLPIQILFFLISVGATLSFLESKESFEYFTFFLGIFVGIATITCLYIYANKVAIKKMYANEDYQGICTFDKRAFKSGDENIEELTARSHTVYSWTAVKSVEIDINHIFIYLGPNFAYIIPQRAFKNDDAFQEFYEQCVVWHKAAQGEAVEDAA